MNEKAFFVIFALLILGAFVSGASQNLNTTTNTNTSSGNQQTVSGSSGGNSYSNTGSSNSNYYNTSLSQNNNSSYSGSSGGSYTTNTKPLTDKERDEIKADLEDLYDELWEIEQEYDAVKRRQPVSGYADNVTLQKTSVYREPKYEYLTLKNDSLVDINISEWYLESYVTDKKVAIPDGVALYRDGGVLNKEADIILKPGQRAYLITGESPIGVSFQENSCMGYIAREESIYPSISYQCYDPDYLRKRYSDIELDDDSCYDFISSVWRCETVSMDEPRVLELSGKCRRFIDEHLNYNRCVDNFQNRTEFDDVNDWYIYFEKDEKLWRQKREIIRLIDGNDRIVDVVEYY